MVPIFHGEHRIGRLQLRAEGTPPRSNANLFGSQRLAWSYIQSDLMYSSFDGRYSVGVGDTAINEHATEQLFYPAFSRSHVEGARYTFAGVIAGNPRERLEASLSVNPYLHVTGYTTFVAFPLPGRLSCVHVCPPPRPQTAFCRKNRAN